MSYTGESSPPVELQYITPEMMIPMPMHNYEQDYPKANIEIWCIYFKNLPSIEKTSLFEQFWLLLSESERSLVLDDLRMFIANGVPGGANVANIDLNEPNSDDDGPETVEDE